MPENSLTNSAARTSQEALQPHKPQATDVGSTPRVFSELVERLNALDAHPTLGEVTTWLEKLHITADDIAPFRKFRDGCYARNRVLRNERIEMLILCWQPGQATAIHDHNGSFGVVRVLEGALAESMFAHDETGVLCCGATQEYQPDAVTGADLPDIHQLGNPPVATQPLVTLHVYCPPLYRLNVYQVGSSESEIKISGTYNLGE